MQPVSARFEQLLKHAKIDKMLLADVNLARNRMSR
jgi:hypothetical protein